MHNLVVRAYNAGPAAALPITLQYTNNLFGNPTSLVIQPLIPGRAMLPGIVNTNQGGAPTAQDYTDYLGYAGAALSTGWPIAVLPPHWGFLVMSTVLNQALTVSLLWEALTPDEFVEAYGEYAA